MHTFATALFTGVALAACSTNPAPSAEPVKGPAHDSLVRVERSRIDGPSFATPGDVDTVIAEPNRVELVVGDSMAPVAIRVTGRNSRGATLPIPVPAFALESYEIAELRGGFLHGKRPGETALFV